MKKYKRMCSLISALLVLCLAMNSVAYASYNANSVGIEISFNDSTIQKNYEDAMRKFSGLTDEEICKLLVHEYGFSEEEVKLLYTIPTIIFNIQFSIESDNRTDIWMESRADYTAFRSG